MLFAFSKADVLWLFSGVSATVLDLSALKQKNKTFGLLTKNSIFTLHKWLFCLNRQLMTGLCSSENSVPTQKTYVWNDRLCLDCGHLRTTWYLHIHTKNCSAWNDSLFLDFVRLRIRYLHKRPLSQTTAYAWTVAIWEPSGVRKPTIAGTTTIASTGVQRVK